MAPDSNAVKKNRTPYLRVGINGKRWLVHVLVLTAFVGPCPPGKECRHLDGNHLNNKLTNLIWGSRKQNAKDRIRHGRSGKGEQRNNTGERNGRAVLTNKQAKKIRRLYRKGEETYKSLAYRFKCSHWTIRSVIKKYHYIR